MTNKPATTNAYEYLTRALQLLEKPRYKTTATQVNPLHYEGHAVKLADHSWIKNAEAFSDQLGKHVKPEDEMASAWCTIGVIKAVTKYDDDPDAAYRYCLSVLNAANPAYIAEGSSNAQPSLNDAGDWPTVCGFFQRAINMAARFMSK